MSVTTTYERDRQTRRTVAGVVMAPGHWSKTLVHAHHRWTGEREMSTWCGLTADLSAGALQTTALVNCVQCAQSSFEAIRR